MLKAVEVQRESKNTDSVADADFDDLARRHGYPGEVSQIVVEKFDEIATSYMKEHFKSAIPVSAYSNI